MSCNRITTQVSPDAVLRSAPVACGLTAPAGVFTQTDGTPYPGGATGVFFNTNKTLVHGAPFDSFGPRIGMAWQPLNERLVVRGGSAFSSMQCMQTC